MRKRKESEVQGGRTKREIKRLRAEFVAISRENESYIVGWGVGICLRKLEEYLWISAGERKEI